MRTHRVALLTGDGIGPVLAREADDLLALLGHRFGFCCETALLPFGREAFTAFGTLFPTRRPKASAVPTPPLQPLWMPKA